MENAELERLLQKHNIYFQWNEINYTWRLTPTHNAASSEVQSGFRADSLEAAQTAAIAFLRNLRPTEHNQSEVGMTLDSLLNKHRLTFNWGNPGLRWWLVGRNKGSNSLSRTEPAPAKDIETAKADAVQFILRNYERTSQESKG